MHKTVVNWKIVICPRFPQIKDDFVACEEPLRADPSPFGFRKTRSQGGMR